jgi:hypothetical protein
MTIDREEIERRTAVLREMRKNGKLGHRLLRGNFIDYEATMALYNWDDPENPVYIDPSTSERMAYLGKALDKIEDFVKKMGGSVDEDFTASVHPLKVRLELSFDLSSLKEFLFPDTGQDQGRAV